jgi:hypothetical protein
MRLIRWRVDLGDGGLIAAGVDETTGEPTTIRCQYIQPAVIGALHIYAVDHSGRSHELALPD